MAAEGLPRRLRRICWPNVGFVDNVGGDKAGEGADEPDAWDV